MRSIHRRLSSFLSVGLIVGLLPGIGFAQELPRNTMSEAYWKLWKPQDQIAYLEELDTLKRPIHLSEITIPAPGEDARANAIQAVIARNMYRLWFSWPGKSKGSGLFDLFFGHRSDSLTATLNTLPDSDQLERR